MNPISLTSALASTLPEVLISLVWEYASDTREKASLMWGDIHLIRNSGSLLVSVDMHGECISTKPASLLVKYIRDSKILACPQCNRVCSLESYLYIRHCLKQELCIWCDSYNALHS